MKVDPATKRHSLGTGILPLARAVLENSGFAKLVQPGSTACPRGMA